MGEVNKDSLDQLLNIEAVLILTRMRRNHTNLLYLQKLLLIGYALAGPSEPPGRIY